MNESQTFGDRSDFAVLYRACPEEYGYTSTDKMAICHLVIGGKLIGKPEECCSLETWLYNLTDRRNRIIDTKQVLYPKEFEGLNDREIFEIILKANQLEEEFHLDFLYLPQVDNEIWSTHSFTLDETIDGYLIYFYVKDNQITFLIGDETGNLQNSYVRNKFIFHSIDFDFFIKTIDQTKEFLLKRYPSLEDNVSSRRFSSS